MGYVKMRELSIRRFYFAVLLLTVVLLYISSKGLKTIKGIKEENCTLLDVGRRSYKTAPLFDVLSFFGKDQCKPREVKLSPVRLPVTGLVSFPGSGNTWTRHLIQQMTGLATSSIFCDDTLRFGGFPYECHHEINKTIAFKTHSFNGSEQFDKIILLIRNPFEAFFSYANFLATFKDHVAHAPKERLKKVARKRFEEMLRNYVNLIVNVTRKFDGAVYVLQYERLKSDMDNELNNLALFLTVSLTQEDIQCTVELQEGNFHRHKNATRDLALIREVYSPRKLKSMQRAAHLAENILKKTYDLDINVGGEIENVLLNKHLLT